MFGRGSSGGAIFGDWDTNDLVNDANNTAELLQFFIATADNDGCFMALEQPSNSLLHKVPFIQATYVQLSAHRVFTWAGAFGASSPKPLEIFTTWPKEAHRCITRPKSMIDPTKVKPLAVKSGR